MTPRIDSKQLAAAAAWLADQKKADNIRIFDVGEELQVADYFVVITGLNRPHVKAIHQELHVRLKAVGETYARAEGADVAWWVLLDYGDVVVHILQPEAREYYDLDGLYADCPQLDLSNIALPAELVLPPVKIAE